MNVFIEPLILYAVLFFRFSAGFTPPTEPVEFSALAETVKMLMYNIPSLALVWYLLLKVKGFREWGVSIPRKKDLIPAVISFPALVLIGLTISFVSHKFGSFPADQQFLPPGDVISWIILTFSCLSSAYLEESFFRFYLLSKREEMKLGPHRAVLISTLMFSCCHIYEGPWGFLNAALSGILLALVFLRYKSLHGVSLAHALYNILVYALSMSNY
jgi:membrane protease YdiL (CAAX protease family)